MDPQTPPPTSSESSGSNPRTPVLSRTSRDVVESVQPGSSISSSGKFRLSPASWSSDTTDSDATIDIPEYLESPETLEYLELEPWKVQQIWNIYTQAMRSGGLGPYTFFDVVKRKTLHASEENAVFENEDWEGVLRRCGMKSKFIRRIMDPNWKEWRLSGSAKEWMQLNLEDRWSFLSNLDTAIQTPERGRATQVTVLDESGHLVTTAPKSKGSGKAGGADPMQQAKAGPSGSGGSKQPPRGLFKPAASTSTSTKALQIPPDEIPGHQKFYKGGEKRRLEKVFGSDGKPNFSGAILSTPPGDFDQNRRGLYLTPQSSMAWKYSQWNAQVDGEDGPKIGMMTIFIPNSLLESKIELVGDLWREFLWVNRRMLPIPKQFEQLDEYDWLVGPVCGQSGDVIGRAQSMSEIKAYGLHDGQSATQWFTQRPSVRRQLESDCQGKIWITETRFRGLGR